MAQSRSLYALLVGINEYDPESGVPALRGCVNDVRAMGRLLIDHFGVPADNILTLVDAAATASAIQSAFQSHLIGNAYRWHAQGAIGESKPAFLFYFSGHGSQARDLSGIEPDGMDETLVAHDSRTPGVFDIRDWELGAWLGTLNEVTEEVTVILDCCHSGSGTRDDDDELPRARTCPPDLRPAPWQRPPATRAQLQRSLSPSNWETGSGHVLIAACRDRELAHEHAVVGNTADAREGRQRAVLPAFAGEIVWRGALSWFLQQTLAELPPDRTCTNGELIAFVRSRVNALYPNQLPQCEGDLDRDFLGSMRRVSDPFFTVLEETDGVYWVDAGLAHGVGAGSVLRVYPPDVRTRAEAATKYPHGLTELTVVHEGVERSGCKITGLAQSPMLARAEVVQAGKPTARRGVRILLEDPRARVRLAQRIESPDGMPPLAGWLKAVARGEDLRVEQLDRAVYINDRAGEPIAGPYAPDDLETVALDLAHIVRFRNVLDLRNEAPADAIFGALHFEIKQLDLSRPKPAAVAIPPGAEGEPTLFAGSRVVFEVANRGARPLYVGIFNLTDANEVALVWPRVAGAHEALMPGKSIALGRSDKPQEQFELWLPEGVLQTRDRYKVIAATSDVNFALLEQGPLHTPFTAQRSDAGLSPLEALLAQGVDGVERSDLPAPRADEWITLDATLTVIAPPPEIVATPYNPATPDLVEKESHSLGEALRVTTPADFTGKVRFLPLRQAIHLHGTEMTQLPPGLAPFPELFAPVAFAKEETGFLAGSGVIEIDCDEATRREISSQTPLRLHLPPQQARALIALAHNGEAWYPVGRAAGGAGQICIEWLPRPAKRQGEGRAASPARVVRLFLFRILEEPNTDLGLFTVRYVPGGWSSAASRASFVRKVAGGDLRYTPAVRFKPGERVALVLHGLAGDSAPISRWLATSLAQLGVQYDRILAFEYEGVGTPVAENATLLAQKLVALGIKDTGGATEGVALDIFAHSMGALIARTYIERLGGDRYVRNSVMAAAPNLGTPLADAALLVPWLITLAVNLPLPSASGLLLAWALGALASEARGVADLGRRATALDALNHSERRVLVRYYLLAGDAGLHEDTAGAGGEGATEESAGSEEQPRAETLLRTLADGITHLTEWYFGDANDLIVGVRSAIGARVQHAPGSVVLTRTLRCNHFGYFESEAVALQVARWLNSAPDAAQDDRGNGNPASEPLPAEDDGSHPKRFVTFRSLPHV